MPKIWTLGNSGKRTQFTYTGSVRTGVILHFASKSYISPKLFKFILARFNGRSIAGGFSMTDPTPGGLGQWVKQNSKRLNGTSLTSRHASFIAAVLVHEGLITSTIEGNAVYLHFPP
jgi:hypothetical protein